MRRLKHLLLSLLVPALLLVTAGAVEVTAFPVPSTDEAGTTRWGYLNSSGKAITDFIYTSAGEFDETGLAAVTGENGKFALINQSGRTVTDWLEVPEEVSSNGLYHALDYGRYIDYYDSSGQLEGSIEGAVGFPGDGLVVTAVRSGRQTLYGYSSLYPDRLDAAEETADKTEKSEKSDRTERTEKTAEAEKSGSEKTEDSDSLAIPAQYQEAGEFRKGRALVKTAEGSYAVINTQGQVLKELPEGAVPTALDIYDTAVILRMQDKYAVYSLDTMQFASSFSYDEILPFDNETARCRIGNRWGLITAAGVVVLEPIYPYLSYMGEGVYAARGTDTGAAAVSEKGDTLYSTDTYVGGFQTLRHGLSWHGNLEGDVVFFNSRGTFVKPLQDVENPRILTSSVALVTRDGLEFYVDIYTGKTIYSSTRSYTLENGLRLTAEVYEKYLGMRSDGTEYGYYVEYPQLDGMENAEIQTKINDAIRSFFVSGPSGAQDRSLDANFGFSVEGQILVVWANGVSGLDASAVIWNDSIGLDLLTGERYTVYDSLFTSDALSVLGRLLPDGPPYYGSPRMDAEGVTFFRNYPAERGREPYSESLRLTFDELAGAIDYDSACYRALSGFQGVVFSDVRYDHWAFRTIAEVARQGWMQGSTDGRFSPSKEMTNVEAMATVSRVLGLEKGEMPEVDAALWYAGDVGGLYTAGLLEGFDEPWLHLTEKLTRADGMQLMANALCRQGAQLPDTDACRTLLAAYTDGLTTPANRRSAAALCVREGLVRGSGGALRPLGTFTRAEFAQILRNFAAQAVK